MGRNHKDQVALSKEIKDAQSLITVGAIYAHHKNKDKLYKVIALGFLESNDQLCVIYQAQYSKGLIFIRPLSVWLENVEWEGKIVPRFKKL